MVKKLSWRFRLLVKSLPYIFAALLFEYKKHPWLYICEYLMLPSTKRYNKSLIYLKRYFKTTETDSGLVVDFKTHKLLMSTNSLKNPADLTCLFPLYFDLSYTQQVRFPIPLILSEGPYEISQLKIEPNDVVFDIGANIGFFSLLAANKLRGGGSGKVYSFEPITMLSDSILKSIVFNAGADKKITIVPYAIGDSNDDLTFHVSDVDLLTGQSSTHSKGHPVVVKQTTIDNFVEKNDLQKIDIIKMDIEGMEPEALMGARKTLATLKPKLTICTYHDPSHPVLLEKMIRDFNPSYKIIHGPSKLYAY